MFTACGEIFAKEPIADGEQQIFSIADDTTQYEDAIKSEQFLTHFSKSIQAKPESAKKISVEDFFRDTPRQAQLPKKHSNIICNKPKPQSKFRAYIENIRELSEHYRTPPEGILEIFATKLAFSVSENGAISNVRIIQSSENKALDNLLVETLKGITLMPSRDKNPFTQTSPFPSQNSAKNTSLSEDIITEQIPTPQPTPKKAEPPKKISAEDFFKKHPDKRTSKTRPRTLTLSSSSIMSRKLGAYTQYIRALAERNWTPPEGLVEKLETKVEFSVSKNGAISNVRIIQSSGNKAFDDSVLAIFRRITLMPPPDKAPHTVTIPFRAREG